MAPNRLEFRPLTELGLSVLQVWLAKPHLQYWWREQNTTLDSLREKYLPRIRGEADATPYLVFQSGEPIGYIQSYCAHNGTADWWPDTPGPGVYGIDQFIGDEDRLDQGLGTQMVSQFLEQLFADHSVVEVRVDPRPDNLRAIRCYAKVGFREVGPISTPDGPAIMMVIKRANFAALI